MCATRLDEGQNRARKLKAAKNDRELGAGLAVLGAIALAIYFYFGQRSWYTQFDSSKIILTVILVVMALGAIAFLLGTQKLQKLTAEDTAATSAPAGRTALELAKERLAAGEITAAEYDEMATRLSK